jgi:hypothetical protein
MDPASALGLISCFTQLAEQTLQLTGKLYVYCSRVKNASARCQGLRTELETISEILRSLTHVLGNDLNVTTSVSKEILERSMAEFGILLLELENRVQPAKTRGIRKFIWPLKELEIEKFRVRIERHEAIFNLALNVFQTLKPYLHLF